MNARCGFCGNSVEIGSGHYKVCEVRILVDELDKKFPKMKFEKLRNKAKARYPVGVLASSRLYKLEEEIFEAIFDDIKMKFGDKK